MRQALWLGAAATLLRAAGFLFGVLNIDESDFCIFGARILHGALPYAGVVDHKPPLTYLAFIPAGLFGGVSIVPMHLLGVAWVVLTSLVLARAAKLWTGSELAGHCAAWLGLLGTLCELPTVASEVLLNLPAAAALYCFIKSEQAEQEGSADIFLAGLSIGIASLFKHQAAVLGPALGLALLLPRPRIGRAALLTLGFALPWLLCIGLYAALGHLAEFMDWVVWRNLSYASKAQAASPWPLLAHSLLLCVGATILPWILAALETLRPTAPAGDRRVRIGLILSLWMTWLAVSSGGRYYEHYFVQFAPPLALLAAPRAASLVARWPSLSRGLRALLIAGIALPALGSIGYSIARGARGEYPCQEPRSIALARWLAGHTAPRESLFVWGHYSPIYYLAQRMPGTRYITTSVHLGNFDPGQLPPGFQPAPYRSDKDVALTLADLEANQVPIVVDTAPADIHGWGKMPLSAAPLLERYVREHYRLIGEPGGARVYRRN